MMDGPLNPHWDVMEKSKRGRDGNGVKFPRDVQQLYSIYYISQSFLYLHEQVAPLMFFFSVLAFVPHPLFQQYFNPVRI